jgi:hypothetical protein
VRTSAPGATTDDLSRENPDDLTRDNRLAAMVDPDLAAFVAPARVVDRPAKASRCMRRASRPEAAPG